MLNENFSVLLLNNKYDIISASGDYFNLTDSYDEKNFLNAIKDGTKDFVSAISDLKKDKFGFCIVELKFGSKINKCLLRVRKTKKKRASYEIYLKEINNFYDNSTSSVESFNIIKRIFTTGNCVIFNYDYDSSELVIYSQNETRVIDTITHLEYLKQSDPASYETIRSFVINEKIPKFNVEVNRIFGFNRCIVKGENVYNDGKAIKSIGVIEEINDNHNILNPIGNLDYTTNVYRKETIIEYAKNIIDVKNQDATLMIMDIDNFKDINDNYGHQYGDKYLYMIADIFKKSVGNNGYIGRIGGDEFMCVIPRCLTIDEIREIARPIRLEIQWISSKENIDVQTSCSIGIARKPIDAKNYDDLFEITDRCLYVAKDKGKNKYVYACEQSLSYIVEERKQNFTRLFKNEQRMEELLSITIECIKNNDLDGLFLKLKKMSISFNIDRGSLYYGEGLKLYKNFGINAVAMDAYAFNNPKHLQTFDEFGFSYIDNTVRYEISDLELDAYYKKLDIKSAMQYQIKNNQGEIIGLLSAEKTNTATSWRGEIANYFAIIAKCIEEILNKMDGGK